MKASILANGITTCSCRSGGPRCGSSERARVGFLPKEGCPPLRSQCHKFAVNPEAVRLRNLKFRLHVLRLQTHHAIWPRTILLPLKVIRIRMLTPKSTTLTSLARNHDQLFLKHRNRLYRSRPNQPIPHILVHRQCNLISGVHLFKCRRTPFRNSRNNVGILLSIPNRYRRNHSSSTVNNSRHPK